ncbi:hypothetical protein Emed_001904 [Eimeria media]
MRASFDLFTTTGRSRGGSEEASQDMRPKGPLKVLLRLLALLLLLLLSLSTEDSHALSCSKNPCSFRRRHGVDPLRCCWLRAAYGGPLVSPGFEGCSLRGPHSYLHGKSAVGLQRQRVRCLGEDTTSAGEAAGDSAEPLRGVHFYVSPTMAAPEVWDDMPRVLRGLAPYEATAVQRLRAAGASLHFLVPRGNTSSSSSSSSSISSISSISSSSSSKCSSSGKSNVSQSPVVHLAVSPTPPLHVDVNASSTAAASSSSSSMSTEGGGQAAANANEETLEEERSVLSHELAFCPSQGSISGFGCFAAATALLEEGPSSSSIAAPKKAPSSPLMDASWGPPALWLCGTEASLLKQTFRVLRGADPKDLRTVQFQQQQQLKRQPQQQQQEEREKPRIRLGLLGIGDRETASLPLSPKQHQMSKYLQQLQQHHRKQQSFHQPLQPGDLPVCRLEAEILRRAVVGGSLLQCCELAGLLLRIGDGGPTKGPPKLSAGERRQLQQEQQQQQQEQQEQQERQAQSYWYRVFCERTEAFSSALKRRLLLGGALLKDPRKAVLMQKARAAQDALRLQLETLLEGVDVLLHVADETSRFALTGVLERRTDAGEENPVDCQAEAANSTAMFRTGGPKEQQSVLCFKQLVAAVAAAGHPCIASANGWVLLGSPGNDELLLDIAAALCSKQHSL